jgi:small subunit ribosomal protein S20
MPNTKSAERRVRANERKRLHNRQVISRVRKAEKAYNAAKEAGNKEEASKALRAAVSAYDNAVKKGTVKKGTADRKKSRLTLALNKLK